MGAERDEVSLRVEVESLERDLLQAIHILYGLLMFLAVFGDPEFLEKAGRVIHQKILQIPQGGRVGRLLIEMDEQNGNILDSHGIRLGLWVYEPRDRT